MKSLCLTLGHNSSAMFVDTDSDEPPVGYEEERLTRIKSDSSFPENAIREVRNTVGETMFSQIEAVFISHWFDNFDPYTDETKYYSASTLEKWVPKKVPREATSISGAVTHHDAHAYSALAFYEAHAGLDDFADVGVIVVDGFGNGQEVASLYSLNDSGRLTKRHVVYGYHNSLGLLYQYAATACGMDGQNDVYKFLGYRTHLKSQDSALCDSVVRELVSLYLPAYSSTSQGVLALTDELIDYSFLAKTQELVHDKLACLIDEDEFSSRARVGYVVQDVLERVVIHYATALPHSTILTAGGCFYNVRLNDKLRSINPHKTFCFNPLAGDQGAALGMAYAAKRVRPMNLRTLALGRRQLRAEARDPLGVERRTETAVTAIEIAQAIAMGGIVNLVREKVEFGPRALCSTSSLALCTSEHVEMINIANGRNTVMPMAPVMLARSAEKLFSKTDLWRTVGSDGFMVTAHNFTGPKLRALAGAMHTDLDGTSSGRPQIVTEELDPFMTRVLDELSAMGVDAIINTSLNVHGEPIIHSEADALDLHKRWLDDCPGRFTTFLVKEA